MDIIKAFKLDGEEHNIRIFGTNDHPLFIAKQIAEITGHDDIKSTLRTFTYEYKVIERIPTTGGMQKTILLTQKGLYRLLGMSRKPNAIKFQEWVAHVLTTLRNEGEYKLSRDNKIEAELLKRKSENITHDVLFKNFKKKNVVYIGKIIDHEKKITVIKIGESDGLENRVPSLIKDYENFQLIDVFECVENRRFEQFLHRHKDIKCYRHEDPVNGKKSNELYVLTDEQYEKVIKIIRANIHHYRGATIKEYLKTKKMELDKMEMENEIKMKQMEFEMQQQRAVLEMAKVKQRDVIIGMMQGKSQEEIFHVLKSMDLVSNDFTKESIISEVNDFDPIAEMEKVDEEEKIEDTKSEYSESVSTNTEELVDEGIINKFKSKVLNRSNGKGPRIQQYDPNTFDLIKTYDSLIDISRDFEGTSPATFRMACRNNTICRGFRWFSIDRNVEVKKYEIPPTIEQSQQRKDLVAELSVDKKKITNVYMNQKEACNQVGLKSQASMTRAIKTESIAAERYWKFFDDCDELMKQEYLKDHDLPEKRKIKGKKIQCLDPVTREVIETYDCITDACKTHKIGAGTIKKCIENDTLYNEFYWRYANDDNEDIIHRMMFESDDEVEEEEEKIQVAEYTPVQEEKKDPEFFSFDMMKRSNKSGLYVQQYNSTTLRYIKTFKFMTDAIREVGGEIKKMKECIENNYEYKGYRWHYIKNTDEDKEYLIPATVIDTNQIKQEFVVFMNKDKNKIEKIYYSMGQVAKDWNKKSVTFISNLIKEKKLYNEGYLILMKDCEKNMIDEYLKHHPLPTKQRNIGFKYQMLHPESEVVIEEFESMSDMIKKYPMGRSAVQKAIEEKRIHNGFYWRCVEV